MKLKKIIGLVIGLFITGLCFYYLGSSISDQWGEFKGLVKNISISFLFFVLVTFSIEYLFETKFVQLILRYQGKVLSLNSVTGIFYLSGLAKYLPLKGVDVLGRFYLFLKAGVSKSASLVTIIFEALYSITGTLLVICLMLVQTRFSNVFITLSCCVALFFMAGFLLPQFVGLLNKITPVILKEKNLKLMELTLRQSFNLLLVTTISKFIIGFAFYLMIRSIHPIDGKFLFQVGIILPW